MVPRDQPDHGHAGAVTLDIAGSDAGTFPVDQKIAICYTNTIQIQIKGVRK
jgi:hypothetical protein